MDFRETNDVLGLVMGNIAQGYSRDWWKDKVGLWSITMTHLIPHVFTHFEHNVNLTIHDRSSKWSLIFPFQHNTHHAATNIVDQDGDIDLVPLFSLIPSDLMKYKEPVERFVRKLVYFSLRNWFSNNINVIFIFRFVPYQHLYYTLALPLLR